MYGILLILTVIILSGLIAYLGDQIGMKVGKKRISLFGLRPKYTSIIITVMTGVLIATLTLTIIMVTNNGIRRAVFQIQEVLIQLDTLNQQLKMKDQNLKEMKQEINVKTDKLATIQLQLSDIGKQRNQLEEKLGQTQQEFEQARKDLTQSRTEISNLEDKRQELENEMNRLNQEIEQLSEEYVRSVYQLASQYDYYIGEDIVYQKGDIIYRTVIDNTSSQEEIVAAITEFLQQANEKVKEQPVKVSQELGSALMIQEAEIFSLPGLIKNLTSDKVIVNLVANANVPKNGWVYATFTINKDFTVFKKGELIASSYVNAAKSPDELEKELENLLENINIKAVRGGLLADEQGSVGSIDFSKFYQLLKQIQNYQGLVEVNVYAREDIWRLDRLSSNMKYEITPVKNEGVDDNNDTGN